MKEEEKMIRIEMHIENILDTQRLESQKD